ncbi:uncharacterized protein LOC128276221 [Anopheles cruzii]|uniref:uncharacterized protein LOC128268339 n=1 Tax=Anopheles cruzii TaxID=68878 RepID=UPI0022EC9567|nr:uncharacterized protein LOC128268339 [Anopheles cruzii]XP_052870656.1 uncharacterized protein LOC128276221 [Anopheles cruzii]
MSGTAKYPSQPTVQREHKLVMVELDNADKTTILYQFLMNEVVHTSDRIERGTYLFAVYQMTSGHFVNRLPVTGVHLPRFSFAVPNNVFVTCTTQLSKVHSHNWLFVLLTRLADRVEEYPLFGVCNQ